MKEKKTAVITFRTEEWVKEQLQAVAEENGYSIAQTIEILCKNFLANPQPGKIIVKTSELLKAAEEIKEYNTTGAVEISIDLKMNEEEGTVRKEIFYMVLECGGRGACFDFDSIPEMTEEEIEEIP